MENLNLQYQLSNGNWVDCKGRTDEFITRCAKNNGPDADGNIQPRFRAMRDLTAEEVVTALLAGKVLRNAGEDWYCVCRMEPAPRTASVVELVTCSCGHTIPRGSVMNASLGTSCPDCYDSLV